MLSHPDIDRMLAAAASSGATAPLSYTVGVDRITIRLPKGERPTDLVSWTADPRDPGAWRIARRDLRQVGAGNGTCQRVDDGTGGTGVRPVALGAATDDPSCVGFIDVAQSPGIVRLTGPHEAARELLCALAVQLAMRGNPTGRTVFLAGDVIPGLAPLTLEQALEDLSRTAPSPQAGQGPVLVWSADEPADHAANPPEGPLRQLADLLAARPDLVVLTTVAWGGAFWQLQVGSDGRVSFPELHLECWADCLAPALAVVAHGSAARGGIFLRPTGRGSARPDDDDIAQQPAVADDRRHRDLTGSPG